MAEHRPEIQRDSYMLEGGVLKMSVLGPYGMDKKTAARLSDSKYFHFSSYTNDIAVGAAQALRGKQLYVSVRVLDMDGAPDPAFATLVLNDGKTERTYEQSLAIEQYDAVVFQFLMDLQ